MAGETEAPIVTGGAPAPAVEAPVAAPAVESAPAAPSVTAEPVSAPEAAPVPEAKPVEAKPAAPTIEKPAPSLLGEAGKEAEAAKLEGDAKPVDAAPAEEKPLPTFEAFVLPEGIQLGEKEVGEFTKDLAEFTNQAGIDQRLVQELGQKMVDRYVAEQVKAQQAQMENWNNTRKGWVDEIKADPVLGRNRLDTVLKDAAKVRDMFATDRFRDAIEYTGMGDHPGMLDFIHNVAKFLDRHGLLGEGKPVPMPPSKGSGGKQGPRARYNASKGA
jgi:hypothetical protein